MIRGPARLGVIFYSDAPLKPNRAYCREAGQHRAQALVSGEGKWTRVIVGRAEVALPLGIHCQAYDPATRGDFMKNILSNRFHFKYLFNMRRSLFYNKIFNKMY